MVERLCESAVAVSQEMIEAAKNAPRWRTVAKQMLHAWNEGMASLRSPKSAVQFRALDAVITAAGFSDPQPPEPARTKIGQSELLAARSKRS